MAAESWEVAERRPRVRRGGCGKEKKNRRDVDLRRDTEAGRAALTSWMCCLLLREREGLRGMDALAHKTNAAQSNVIRKEMGVCPGSVAAGLLARRRCRRCGARCAVLRQPRRHPQQLVDG